MDHVTARALAKTAPIPKEDEADSLQGLGGFITVRLTPEWENAVLAIGVYSEKPATTERKTAFLCSDAPWKNVVATFITS